MSSGYYSPDTRLFHGALYNYAYQGPQTIQTALTSGSSPNFTYPARVYKNTDGRGTGQVILQDIFITNYSVSAADVRVYLWRASKIVSGTTYPGNSDIIIAKANLLAGETIEYSGVIVMSPNDELHVTCGAADSCNISISYVFEV